MRTTGLGETSASWGKCLWRLPQAVGARVSARGLPRWRRVLQCSQTIASLSTGWDRQDGPWVPVYCSSLAASNRGLRTHTAVLASSALTQQFVRNIPALYITFSKLSTIKWMGHQIKWQGRLSKVNTRDFKTKNNTLNTKLLQADLIIKWIVPYIHYFKFLIRTQDNFIKEGLQVWCWHSLTEMVSVKRFSDLPFLLFQAQLCNSTL